MTTHPNKQQQGQRLICMLRRMLHDADRQLSRITWTSRTLSSVLQEGAMGVTVRVYPDGLVNIERFRWFGIFGPKVSSNNLTKDAADVQAATKEVWEWLTEWNYVKLIPIGPEDSEYFATSKLTGEGNDGNE